MAENAGTLFATARQGPLVMAKANELKPCAHSEAQRGKGRMNPRKGLLQRVSAFKIFHYRADRKDDSHTKRIYF